VVDARESDYPNPGDNVLSWPVQNIPARDVRFTATRLFSRWNDYVFALAELEVFADGRNVALGAAVTCPEESPNSAFRPEYLVDGRSSSGPLFPLESWLGTLAHRAELEQRLERVKRQADIARIRQTERRITLSWLAGFSVLLGGLGLVWQVRRQRVREFQALREQIARDLHDEIGSSLGSISLLSELGKQDGDLGSLEEIHQLATEAADSMRGILWMIRDGKAPSLPQLEEAMRTQARLALRGADCQFTSQNPIPPVAVSLEFNRNLFLLFKEALHNAGRHAAASTVSVHLVWNARSLSLTVEDNGCGFDVDALFSGSGLINMRHRATALNARLEFYSAPGRGTRIALEVPLL
jgi:signal transduction histidine kinase